MKKWIILSVALAVLLIGGIYVSSFKLESVQITGCDNVDEQTIKDAVLKSKYSGNTLMLYIAQKISPIEDIPFVDKVEVEFITKNSIAVTVYEKAIAGCVEYMNGYVFFDKDGIVLESGDKTIPGVPCIKGLKFEQWEMGKKLPIDDTLKFKSILTITQLIDKYDLTIDGIRYSNDNEITLMYKDILIELGDGDNLAIQMMNLGSMLEVLDGKEGNLYMKNVDSNKAIASFKEAAKKNNK